MKIKKFKIKQLHGYRDVDIDLSDSVKILIGENGLGKTTILNIIYYTLSKKFKRLSNYNFESIEVVFNSRKKVVFTKQTLLKYLNLDKENNASHFGEFLSKIKEDDEKKIRKIINHTKSSEQDKRIELNDLLKKSGLKIGAPAFYIFDLVKKYYDEIDGNKFYDTIKVIDEVVDCKILYFPTYRRIEEDIRNIGINNDKEFFSNKRNLLPREEKNKDDIIQFGMTDVDSRIQNITKQITHSSMIGFSDITAEMLHQLLTDFPDITTKIRSQKDINKLKIMLDRIGQKLSPEDHIKIQDFIDNGNTDNKGLIFFVNKLIDLYNNLENQDNAIKNFIDVCNNYLVEKKYVYDEREVILNIQHQNPKYIENNKTKVIELDKLSSGEKQIVSLFSKIFLEQNDRFIILFDEPELSLSIFWQQRLLQDIINSNKCDLLFAVTHSPFIYEEHGLYNKTFMLKDYIN
ncbi:AAA family ATPase [Wenyingzhuangia aestuarii]|uniref:AAA family ATPase n=1 Tax=Wenyingzhuangia aestuarii TaxID=1647582 RepID=UPI00143CAADB|nr:AAA family ATPase [Wenyingzhuangia aestuarii]NJB84185.1 putative ATP-dependent endonuclease of OLD family [Wenyingzhuangia aestuarii]